MQKASPSRLADRLALALVAACLLAPPPALAEDVACSDPATVAAVLRVLSGPLGLSGALALDHIRGFAGDPALDGPRCEADVAGIRDGPQMFGRALDRVQYWGGLTNGTAASRIDARLTPGAAKSAAAPALLDAAQTAR